MLNVGAIAAAIGKGGARDPYWSNVVLLMPMENNFTDAKGHSLSLNGTPVISSSGNPAPYGTNCGSFGNGNCAAFTDSDDWHLGINNYTVEYWIRPTAADLIGDYGGIHVIINQRSGDNNGKQWGLSNGKLFHWLDGVTVVRSTGTSLVADTAYHIAFSRVGSFLYCFINGVLDQTIAYSYSLANTSAVMVIGGEQIEYGQDFFGTLKDVRITKGVGRYSSNFTPPTLPYPTN